MKIKVHLNREAQPLPLLSFVIYDAPHKRVHWRVLQRYREELRRAFRRAGIFDMIDEPVDYQMNFIDPTSPDNDNLLTALHRALDDKALIKPGLIADDSLLQGIRGFYKFWTKVP